MIGFGIGFFVGLALSLEMVAALPALITGTDRQAWIDWWLRSPQVMAFTAQLSCALIGGAVGVIIQRAVS
jgi:hypothetical protein